MVDLVAENWKLNRSAVNPDTDKFAKYLQDKLDANVLEVKSGEQCLTWEVPQTWEVRSARLLRTNGEVIADYKDNPLHLWTHSVPFVGEVSREELLSSHIHTDPNRPDEFLYHYRNGFRSDLKEWGFSLPYKTVAQLNDPVYKVEIDSSLNQDGSLKVVDAYLPGKFPETIFLMAHTCHPALVSDGIACIAVAAELYHYLKSLPERQYSYRFLFGPEYFAAAAYLQKGNKSDIKNLKYGVFLDMISNHEPMGYQYSMQSNSRLDQVTKNVFQSHLPFFIEKPYRQLWGNDEMFYNGAGFEIPTIGIGRGEFREYHYDTDNIENMNVYHMEESIWVLQRIIEVFETDYVPVRNYQGPLYLSKHGIYIDPTVDRELPRKIERLQVLMDGTHSCFDIAHKLNLDFYYVRNFCDQLVELGFVSKSIRQPRTEDAASI